MLSWSNCKRHFTAYCSYKLNVYTRNQGFLQDSDETLSFLGRMVISFGTWNYSGEIYKITDLYSLIMSYQKSNHSILRLIPCLEEAKSTPNNESWAKNLSHGWLNRTELEVSQQLRDIYCNSQCLIWIITVGQCSSFPPLRNHFKASRLFPLQMLTQKSRKSEKDHSSLPALTYSTFDHSLIKILGYTDLYWDLASMKHNRNQCSQFAFQALGDNYEISCIIS